MLPLNLGSSTRAGHSCWHQDWGRGRHKELPQLIWTSTSIHKTPEATPLTYPNNDIAFVQRLSLTFLPFWMCHAQLTALPSLHQLSKELSAKLGEFSDVSVSVDGCEDAPQCREGQGGAWRREHVLDRRIFKPAWM